MKLTHLQYVQDILSALSSDEVNSIGDTVESRQVSTILKTAFFNICARAHLLDQTKLFQLDSSTSPLEPVLMFVPQGIKEVQWLKYYNSSANATPGYEYVTLIGIQQFIDFVNGYDPSQSFVETMQFANGAENFQFRFRNDTQPRFACVISNYYVIFDAFDQTLDSTLQSSKTQCYGLTTPIWLEEDSFIPDIDESQVPLLLNEAKSLAFFELKQQPHQKAEQEAKRQWSSLQRDKSIDNKPSYFDQLPDFGRTKAFSRRPYFKWH